ncbi:MAG: hypothetical protein AUK53_01445 [Betaproteobacteria bacterium CG2_30_59_46]|nr:MAG: hypothetical protein AUK53_01445 [Betaproteobacteria bacterium CG2_30_59_46]PIQ13703.1 MAG: hypothetical protein COW70_03235 [Hydrogenophilales bacterium CG18_big_fil_WC_8_21_14_2_50_58_12]PIX99419.1 MAG: hypothetical protein COZ23_11315 [Hydrogenophilales bacterium CG_4_10_14_3_um_filter_58_23]PJB05852.1 MAG: hypothetical protein CO125_08195 [Hydrogenophilales bacterium CG_4_9_14_3_um_filter_59_35]
MAALKENLARFWQGLNTRERQTVSLGSAVLLAGLGYAFVWQPLAHDRVRLHAALPGLRAQAAQFQSAKAEAQRLKAIAVVNPSAQTGLQKVLEESAAAAGLHKALERIVPESADRATLMLNNANFDQWLAWQVQLQTVHHIRLESCVIETLTQTGLVKIQAVVVRG